MALSSSEFEWTVINVEEFQARLKKLGEVSGDFRIPFRFIASDFYRSQKQLFDLKGPGLYADLSEKPFYANWKNDLGYGAYYSGGYKQYKFINVGFVYPILVGQSRDLSNSTLSRTHKYSIFSLDKVNMEIGSSVPYGKYHQSDKARQKIPQRKFVFIAGGSGDKSKGSGINGRRERWLDIIDTHYKQLITGEI